MTTSNFEQLALAMGQLPRYRNHTIADLVPLVLEPLVLTRVAIVTAKQGRTDSLGFVIWASVSEAVDAKINEQVKAGAFPVRLAGGEWTSGDVKWLLDVIAPSKALAGRVLLAFGKTAGEQQIQIHPVVSRVVDASLLEALKRTSADQQ